MSISKDESMPLSLKELQHFSDPIMKLWSGVVAILLGYVITVAIYRLWFHPLAKYPGPLLGRLTNGYIFYWTISGRAHIQTYKLHREYGPFVRLRPNALSINNSEAIKDIYGYKANVQKSKTYTTFSNRNHETTHSMIDKKLHARKRRILAHCFSDATLKSLGRHVITCTNTFNRVLASSGKAWGKAYDMSSLCNSLTFDIMGAVTFSKSYGMTEYGENMWVQDAILCSGKHKYMFGFLQAVYKTGLDILFCTRLTLIRKKFTGFAANQMKERMAAEDKEQDFVQFMLKAKDPQTGEGFSFMELAAEAQLLIGAGSDTTSTALAAAFYFMTHEPTSFKKLVSEARTTFSSIDEIVAGPKLSGCRYLRAFADESMRLSPPVPASLYREVLPGGLKVAGEFISEGLDVTVPSYTVMRNSEYYPEPERFLPERWIENAADPASRKRIELAQSAFCPFSVGPRSCIGRSLAYHELLTVIGRTVWLFDIKLLPGSSTGEAPDGSFRTEDWFIAKKSGPLAQFKVRQELDDASAGYKILSS